MIKKKEWNKDLLPCPFCGGDGEMACFTSTSRERWYVGCSQENCCEIDRPYASREKAIEAWNHREDLQILSRVAKWDDSFDNIRRFQCSYCKEMHILATKYCPSCGARME